MLVRCPGHTPVRTPMYGLPLGQSDQRIRWVFQSVYNKETSHHILAKLILVSLVKVIEYEFHWRLGLWRFLQKDTNNNYFSLWFLKTWFLKTWSLISGFLLYFSILWNLMKHKIYDWQDSFWSTPELWLILVQNKNFSDIITAWKIFRFHQV